MVQVAHSTSIHIGSIMRLFSANWQSGGIGCKDGCYLMVESPIDGEWKSSAFNASCLTFARSGSEVERTERNNFSRELGANAASASDSSVPINIIAIDFQLPTPQHNTERFSNFLILHFAWSKSKPRSSSIVMVGVKVGVRDWCSYSRIISRVRVQTPINWTHWVMAYGAHQLGQDSSTLNSSWLNRLVE